jgi:glyceraldehyde-3-phosphate dehydrogenase (NADP+)
MNKGSLDVSSEQYASKPYVDGAKVLYGGQVIDWTGEVEDVTSPILDSSTGKRIVIGRMAQMSGEEALKVHAAAKAAWKNGTGVWPQMSMQQRVDGIIRLVEALKERRAAIVQTLMWEICKNTADAAAEFDRTMLFIEATIKAIKDIDAAEGQYQVVSGIQARVRRAAVGVMLALGPFNYPFNETYTTLIPALLMGNVVIMKIPTLGGLAHVITMEAYASALPPGVVNFVSGSGRVTMGPIMQQGVDIFAFIGGSKAADTVLKSHPNPHRLKVFLSLEGKNLAIVTPDADIDVAAEQCTIGSTTYNGQRCTAIKMMFIHESISQEFLTKLSQRINALKAGLPWESGVAITPLPEHEKITFLQNLINDAVSKGATVVNADGGGGQVFGNIMQPAIVAPVTENMELWHKEQFGPVVPVAIYKDIAEVYDYIYKMPFGQQAAIFTKSVASAAPLIDILSTAVGRININTQCGRSPDSFPFSGRRSSALGTLSVTEALRTFSVETVLAGKQNELNDALMRGAESACNFLAPLNK